MMNYSKYFLAILLFMTFACQKKNPMPTAEVSYFIFGHYFGMCGGEECIEVFKITEDSLFEDIDALYPVKGFYEGDFTALSRNEFEAIEGFPNSFHTDLLHQVDTTFGMPDAYDQGGLYIERKTEETHFWWHFDRDTSNVPGKYHSFHQEIIETIKTINE